MGRVSEEGTCEFSQVSKRFKRNLVVADSFQKVMLWPLESFTRLRYIKAISHIYVLVSAPRFKFNCAKFRKMVANCYEFYPPGVCRKNFP